MIGLVIGLVTFMFFATGTTFGQELIYTLDVMENWYYFVMVILGILTAIVFGFGALGGAAAGAEKGGRAGALLGMIGGGAAGGLIAGLMIFTAVVQVSIVTWLMGSIDPSITSLDGLTTKQGIGLVFMIIFPILMRLLGGNSSSK